MLAIDVATQGDGQANFAGTDASGTSSVGNGGDGIRINLGAANNIIGGMTVASRNVISGNLTAGVALGHSAIAGGSSNQVLNYIGTNAAGTGALSNAFEELLISDSSSGEIIGTGGGQRLCQRQQRRRRQDHQRCEQPGCRKPHRTSRGRHEPPRQPVGRRRPRLHRPDCHHGQLDWRGGRQQRVAAATSRPRRAAHHQRRLWRFRQ